MKRIGVWWLVLLVLAGAVGGCAQRAAPPAATTPAPTQEAVELTVIGPWSGAEEAQFTPVLQAAEQKLGVKISYRVYRAEDLSQLLPAQFEARQTPGDVIFMWSWWIEKNGRHAVDLGDVWSRHRDAFLMQALEADGRVVGVPYAVVVKPGFWYRKSFFEKHGLTPPATWEDFVALLQRIEQIPGIKDAIATGDGVGWPISDVTEHFLIAFGGPQLQRDLIAGRVAWTDPQVKAIFRERIVPLLEYFSDPIEWTQAKDLWWNGEYALFFMGNWLTGMVDDPSDLGVFPLPGAKGAVMGTDYMFVPAYSGQVDAAKRLVDFLLSREGMEIRARQGGKLAGRKDVSPDVYPPADAELARAVAGMEALPDLDDSVGGDWQRAFWDQLKLLWVRPEALDEVLSTLQEKR